MAGSKSDYLENKLLDHMLGGATYSQPADVWVGLYTVAPTDAGGGTECSGGSYARVQVPNESGDSNWDAAASGAKANTNDITFPEATGDRGEVVAFGIFDADSAGNLLYWGDLTANKTINTGDTAKFAAGDIDITED